MPTSRFIKELQRRNVIRAALTYIAVGWVIIQAASIVFPAWNLPGSAMRLLILVIIICYPIWLILAWFYRISPDGFKKDEGSGDNEQTAEIKNRTSNLIIIGGLSLAVVLLVADRILNLSEGFLNPDSVKSLAVLPFANLSGDPQQTYFADGMQDELIGHLARLDHLRVISRTSTLRYRNTDLPIKNIAEQLNVDYIVEGSLMKFLDTVRIQVQLIDGIADEDHLWNRMYDRELKAVLNMHNEVTRDIARSIQLVLSSQDREDLKQSKVVNPDAYNALLKARFHLFQFTPQSIQLALNYVNQAMQIDPEMAEAFAMLSNAGGFMLVLGMLPPDQAGKIMVENAKKSLALDPSLAISHGAMASAYTWSLWDWEQAEESWRICLDIDPNNAITLIYYSHYLACMGRYDEAIINGQKALEQDPFNPFMHALYSVTLMHAELYEEAIATANKALEMDPSNPFPLGVLDFVSFKLGRKEESFRYQLRLLQMIGDTTLRTIMELASREKGIEEAYLRAAEELKSRRKDRYVRPFRLVMLYDKAAAVEQALNWLDSSYVYRDHNMVYSCNGPFSDEFKSHERFKELMRKMNFTIPVDPSK